MKLKVRGHGNGHSNHRTWNVSFETNYDPKKLKKYLVLRNGVKVSVFMFKLKPTDIVIKLLWESGKE